MRYIQANEEDQAREVERAARLREIAWRHVEASHERHETDRGDGEDNNAYQESCLTIQWVREYRELRP